MVKRDYYEILGVDKSADEAAIKRTYRSQAMNYHPDRNPGDKHASDKMTEINEAYAVLSDRKKKQLYDTYGHAGLEGYSTSDIFGGVDFASLFREFGLGDLGFGGSIFDSLFGTGRRASTRERSRGADLRYDLEVSLEEAALGFEKEIEIPRRKPCESCKGSGAKEGGLNDCEICGGSGQIVAEKRSGNSIFRQISVCSNCRGEGKIIKDVCEKCQGKGFIEEIDKLLISVPRGADTGYRIRFEGKGQAAEDGIPPGDLYIILSIEDHPVFERHGDDIYMALEIGFALAALGGEINDVPGLEGDVELEIPEGTQTGAIVRIGGKGIPHLDGYGRGDQYVMIKVVTPQNLTDQEKEVIREFDKLQHEKESREPASSLNKDI